MKRFLIILLIAGNCYSQATTTVLKAGSSYNWKISRMTDRDSTAVFFTFNCAKGVNSNGFYIGITEVEEVKYLISELRIFASITDGLEHYQRYDAFEITLPKNSVKIMLNDCLGGYLYLSKTSCRSLATEIENNLQFMNQ